MTGRCGACHHPITDSIYYAIEIPDLDDLVYTHGGQCLKDWGWADNADGLGHVHWSAFEQDTGEEDIRPS